MNLLALRTEVLNHGFDPTLFGLGRINQYLNDGYNLICRRVQFYGEEAVQDFATVAGTSTYAWPANVAAIRSLRDTQRNLEMASVTLRDIDRSGLAQGAPAFYALDAANVHLYPIPDGVYQLELRYWMTPAALVNDTDTSLLPDHWEHLLWVYAVWMCYESEDDTAMGQYWAQRFGTEMAEFAADAKFPSTDIPAQAEGMWGGGGLSPNGWSLWVGG